MFATLRELRGRIKIGSFGEISLKHEKVYDLGGVRVNYPLPSFILFQKLQNVRIAAQWLDTQHPDPEERIKILSHVPSLSGETVACTLTSGRRRVLVVLKYKPRASATSLLVVSCEDRATVMVITASPRSPPSAPKTNLAESLHSPSFLPFYFPV